MCLGLVGLGGCLTEDEGFDDCRGLGLDGGYDVGLDVGLDGDLDGGLYVGHDGGLNGLCLP